MADHLAIQVEGSLEKGEQDYLDTLSLLIEEYDRAHRPAGQKKLNGIDILRHLMEANEMSVSSLGKLLGSKGVASEILSGKRSLSKNHMLKLAARFNLDAGAFLC
jgi:HTH-type transcriptional regulator/antitoxin HigA